MGTLTVLNVELQDFAWAANSTYHHAAVPLARAILALNDALAASGGMAGGDVGGVQWASAYDGAARQARHAGQDAMNACFRLSAMFTQSARNYEAAEAASSARAHADPTHSLPHGVVEYTLAGHVPSAVGADPLSLVPFFGNDLSAVVTAIGLFLPNGHQDRLHATASAWRHAADALDHAAGIFARAPVPFGTDGLPEADDMSAVCLGLRGQLEGLAGVYRSLAQACDDYAHHLDVVRSGIENALFELAWQTALIEGGSGLLAWATDGLSEIGGNALEASRVSAIAARIAELIQTFLAGLNAVAASVAAALARLDEIAGSLAGLVDVPFTYATVQVVRSLPVAIRTRELVAARSLARIADGLPAMTFRTSQIEKKFKHAADFGLVVPRGTAGFKRFEQVLEDFLEQPGTVRISPVRGRYNKEPAIISYNPSTRLVVIQRADGGFWSGWRMTKEAMYYLRKYGTLGGR